ncbi:MAG: lysophospholipase [Chloroflexi bacterium]|nr:lysophospholipase [Chloroflexota bacterium]
MIKTKDRLDLFTKEWVVPNARASVVLTHGFGEHSGRYEHVAEFFNRAEYSVFAYDMRGHGRSEGARGHTPSYDHFQDDLSRVITRTKQRASTSKIILFGHSLGGNIALHYGMQRPSGLNAIIASAPWLRRAIEAPAWQTVLARIMASIFPSFSQQTPSLAGMLTRDPAMAALGESDPLNHSRMSARLFIDVSAAADNLLANAKKFKLPLLVTHGTADPVIALSGSEDFVNNAGSTDKTLLARTDGLHELHNDLDRSEYLSLVVDWLDARVPPAKNNGFVTRF